VEFNNNFRDSANIDLRHEDGLLAQELPGILNWMLIGYRMLMKEKRFAVTREQLVLLAEYREENSSVEGFIAECLFFSPEQTMTTTKAYGEYKDYCMKDGRKFKSAIAFTKEMKAHGRRTNKFWFVERANGRTPAFFKGIGITTSWDTANFEDTSPRINSNYQYQDDDDVL
jgi:phage/plasmid-associated DNA primase